MDPIERAVKIGRAYDEKARQIDPESLSAFGISISTRYGKCYEMEEMLAFCREVAEAGAATFVTEIFYDSKACIANITFEPSAASNWTVVHEAEAIADRTLSQYMRQDGSVGGKPIEP